MNICPIDHKSRHRLKHVYHAIGRAQTRYDGSFTKGDYWDINGMIKRESPSQTHYTIRPLGHLPNGRQLLLVRFWSTVMVTVYSPICERVVTFLPMERYKGSILKEWYE